MVVMACSGAVQAETFERWIGSSAGTVSNDGEGVPVGMGLVRCVVHQGVQEEVRREEAAGLVFERGGVDAPGVAAGSLFAVRVAGVAPFVDDRHGAAAFRATQDAGKGKRGLRRGAAPTVLAGLAAVLDEVPERVVDDAELGYVLDDPFGGRNGAGLAPAGVGISDEALAAVDHS